MSDTWTDERVADLKRFHAEGWSSSQIGARLGVTRNAVIGKVARLGLSMQDRTQRARVKKDVPAVTRKHAAASIKLAPVSPSAVTSLPSDELRQDQDVEPIKPFGPRSKSVAPVWRPLHELGSSDCRWPRGDRVPYEFCGAPQCAHSSYCAYHRGVARQYGRLPNTSSRKEQ